jgi:hypothetical protein
MIVGEAVDQNVPRSLIDLVGKELGGSGWLIERIEFGERLEDLVEFERSFLGVTLESSRKQAGEERKDEKT